MPSFKGHCYFNAFILIIILIIINHFHFLTKGMGIALAIGFYFGTYWLTPDLDTASIPYNSHGWLWKLIWKPYKDIWKHRKNSHEIFAGIFVRLIYFGIILLAIILVIEKLLEMPWLLSSINSEVQAHLPFIEIVISGVVLANMAHIVIDRIT